METKLKYIVISVEDANKDNPDEYGIDLKVIFQDYPEYIGHIFVYRNLRFVEKNGDFFIEANLEHIKPGGISTKKDKNNKIDDDVEKLMNKLINQIIYDVLDFIKEENILTGVKE